MFREVRRQKKIWRNTKRRVKNLPSDYQYVYKQMQKYIFKVAILDESEVNAIFTEVLNLFEQGVLSDKHVLEVTGKDVAVFCDTLVEDKASHYDEVIVNVEKQVQLALEKVYQKRK